MHIAVLVLKGLQPEIFCSSGNDALRSGGNSMQKKELSVVAVIGLHSCNYRKSLLLRKTLDASFKCHLDDNVCKEV